MKQKLLITLVLFSLLGGVIACPAAFALTSQDYISWWQLDDADASTWILDQTGAADGVLYGKTWYDGTVTGATHVDSKNASMGYAMEFDGSGNEINGGNIAIGEQYTIGFWFNKSSAADGEIMYKSNELLIRSTSGVVSCMYSSSYTAANTVSFAIGDWTYITCSYDGTNINSYLNGVYQSSTAVSAKTPTANNFYIGRALFASGFIGNVDAVRIWNRALSESEIQQEMNSHVPVNNDHLIAAYEFDYDYNRALVQEEISEDSFAGANDIEEFLAQPFTATSSGYINNVSLELQKLNSGGAINVSIYTDHAGQPGEIMTNEYHVAAGDIAARQFYNYVFDNPITVTSGTQYWIVVKNETYDTSDRAAWSYLNSGTAAISTDGGSTWSNFTSTMLHNLTIYSYNNTNDSTLARDTNHLSLKDYSSPLGQAMYFDGVNDYVSASFGQLSDSFTLSAWIKIQSDFNSYPNIFGSTTADAYFCRGSLGGDSIYCRTNTAGGLVTSYINDVGLNDYAHIVFTYNGSTQKTYLNGIEKDSDDQSGSIVAQSGTLHIARNGGSYFNGSLADIRIYDRALDPEEIEALYYDGTGDGYGFIHINATDYYHNSSIENFSVTVTDGALYTVTTSTTDGEVDLFLPTGTYSANISAIGYATHNLTKTGISITDLSTSYQEFVLYQNNSLFITFKDMLDFTVLNGTNISLDVIGDYYAANFTTDNGTFYTDHLPTDTYDLRFSADNYEQSTYSITIAARSYNEITLYLSPSNETAPVLVTIYDEINAVVPDAYVKSYIYSVESNAYVLQEVVKTNMNGQASFNIVLYDEYYKFVVEYPQGTVKKTTAASQIYTDTIDIQIFLGEPIAEDYYNTLKVTGNMTFNNATHLFRFDWNDPNNAVYQGCIYVYRVRSYGNDVVNTSCSQSASGIIYGYADNITNVTYISKGYITYNSTGALILLAEEYSENGGSLIASFEGMFWTLMIMCMFGFIGIWNPAIAAILFPLPLTFAKIIGLITLSWTFIIPIQLLGIIVAIIMMNRS